jgi:holo-[acyl-carrier protein] synthase
LASRVGIDLVSIDSVSESIERFGDHYLNRIYTEREQQESGGVDGPDAASLAARFAAKEAAVKVLRPAPDDAVGWLDIEVQSVPGAGWTQIELSGRALDLAQSGGLDEWSVSLTHENGYAAAVVAAEVKR